MPWNDAKISSAILAGDTEAETELVRRFRQRVSWMVRRALSGGPDCEDLTSEILQATLNSLRRGRFRGDCQLATFVHAITRNKINEHIRRRRPEMVELSENVPDPSLSPEEVTARSEAAEAVRAALGELDARHRNVLYLYYYRGLSVGEIAKRLGVPGRRISEWKDYALKVIRARSGRALNRFR